MKRALISDIHGNLEALRAVLDDIERCGVDQTICLGDLIGYGPNPCECIDTVARSCAVVILGNHDQLSSSEQLSPLALQVADWTRQQLESRSTGGVELDRQRAYLERLPRCHVEAGLLFVHGSPREPTNEYVYPEDIADEAKMAALFHCVEQYCFQGHTHIPGIFTADHQFVAPPDCNYRFELAGQKLMINVGSVGQPRDADPRACYVILQDDQITFRRIEYPVEEMMRKLRAMSERP